MVRATRRIAKSFIVKQLLLSFFERFFFLVDCIYRKGITGENGQLIRQSSESGKVEKKWTLIDQKRENKQNSILFLFWFFFFVWGESSNSNEKKKRLNETVLFKAF